MRLFIYYTEAWALIGENATHTVMQDGGSLEAIADKYKIGLLAMLEANPGTDPWLPRPGTVLTIPSKMLLLDTPRKGIVINLAELRLLPERGKHRDCLPHRYRPTRAQHACYGDVN